METLYTQAEVAEILDLKPRTLANWRSQGKGPSSFLVGGRVRYRQSAVEKYLRDAEAAEANT